MKKYLDKVLFGVGIALAVAAILMLLAPAVVAKVGNVSYTGFEAAFGKSVEQGGIKLIALDASAAILPFLLIIVGVVLTVVALSGKGGKAVPVAAAVVLVVAGVLYFMNGLLLSPHYYEDYGVGKSEFLKQCRESFKIGYGSIVGGIFSILAGIVCVVPVILKKLDK